MTQPTPPGQDRLGTRAPSSRCLSVPLSGDPAFYARFGFANNPALVLEGVPQEFFLSLSLSNSSAHGNVQFHTAFQATG